MRLRARSPRSLEFAGERRFDDFHHFLFFLCDIVGLPFDSNFTKVGVSPYIGTNGAFLIYTLFDRTS